MPSEPISALPAASALAGSEPIPCVQGGATKRTTPDALKTHTIGALNATSFVYTDGTSLLTDTLITHPGAGGLNVEFLSFSQNLTLTGLLVIVDNGGNVTGNTLHALNGFNGSGIFTTFTIVDGIITAAS